MKDTKKTAKMEENARVDDECLNQVAGGTGYWLPWGPSSHNGQSAEGAPLYVKNGEWYMHVKDEYGMEYYQPSGEVKEV